MQRSLAGFVSLIDGGWLRASPRQMGIMWLGLGEECLIR